MIDRSGCIISSTFGEGLNLGLTTGTVTPQALKADHISAIWSTKSDPSFRTVDNRRTKWRTKEHCGLVGECVRVCPDMEGFARRPVANTTGR